MKIFLTGASGFVCSYVLRQLVSSRKHEVAILLRSPESAWRIQDLIPNVQVIVGNLYHPGNFEPQVAAFGPDAVVHMAWDGVLGSDRNSLRQWRNIPAALELVEMAARVGARHWIGLGSQAEYGPCQNRIDESVPTNPTTLYGVSKLATCNLVQRLCDELGIRFGWIRLFSSYGPADNPSLMIPYLIESLLKGERPKLTRAEQMWDYIYIEDAAAAIVAVTESREAVGVFNLGSGTAPQLKAVIEKIRNLVDPTLPVGFGEVDYRQDQVMHLEADISRLKKFTGWSPVVDIETGLKKTVAWHLRQKNNGH